MLTITVEESHPSLAGADTLVVFLHANTISVDSLSAIAAATNEVVPGARFIEPFSLMGCLSFEDPTYITREFVLQIDDQWEEYRRRHGRDYKEIILVGYDLDALLVRKVYLLACGENFDAPVKGDNGTCFATPRPWVRCIQRIILLAGMNCGCRRVIWV
jgi:hypothetical protein